MERIPFNVNMKGSPWQTLRNILILRNLSKQDIYFVFLSIHPFIQFKGESFLFVLFVYCESTE